MEERLMERPQAEEALKESEERYRVLFDSIDEGFCIGDVLFEGDKPVDYLFVQVNPAFEKHTGLRRVVGCRMRELAPALEESWYQGAGRVALTGEPVRFERPAGALGRTFDVYAFRTGRPEQRRVAALFSDITERKRAAEALRRSETRYRMLHESLRDAYVQVAMDGRLTEFNGVFCRMVGYSPAELRTKRYQDLTPARWHAFEEEIVRTQILAHGYSEVYEKEYRRKDGTIIPVELRTILYRDDEGRPAAMWALVRDITDRKRAEQELRSANLQLAEADRRKNGFLAVLSHELRNPLATIATSLYILDHAPSEGETWNRAKQVIGRQVLHLSSLVNDLLDVTRVTRDKVQLQKERVELNELVHRSVEDNRHLFECADVRLELEPALGPVFVFADRTRVAQIVGNLLQNAAKFTGSGGHTRLSVAVEGRDAVLRVADDGAGMREETLAGLFQPFMQADQTLDRSKGGLGLGLALVKALVELHGGSIAAQSEGLGKGSEFVVHLPLDGSAAREPAATHPSAVSAQPRSP